VPADRGFLAALDRLLVTTATEAPR
jgi:hypothetical protein